MGGCLGGAGRDGGSCVPASVVAVTTGHREVGGGGDSEGGGRQKWVQFAARETLYKVLGVTSCPLPRTGYMHDVRILYMSLLSLLFNICEQCWYQRCVTSIKTGGDVLVLGIRFILCIMFEVFLKVAKIEARFWAPLETAMCIYIFKPFWPKFGPAFWFRVE